MNEIKPAKRKLTNYEVALRKKHREQEHRQFQQAKRERKLKEQAYLFAMGFVGDLRDRVLHLEHCLASRGLKIVKMSKSENAKFNKALRGK